MTEIPVTIRRKGGSVEIGTAELIDQPEGRLEVSLRNVTLREGDSVSFELEESW